MSGRWSSTRTDAEQLHFVLGSVVRRGLAPGSVRRDRRRRRTGSVMAALRAVADPPRPRTRARILAMRLGFLAALMALGFGAGWLILAAQALAR